MSLDKAVSKQIHFLELELLRASVSLAAWSFQKKILPVVWGALTYKTSLIFPSLNGPSKGLETSKMSQLLLFTRKSKKEKSLSLRMEQTYSKISIIYPITTL